MHLKLIDLEERVTVQRVVAEPGVYQQHINGSPTRTFFRKSDQGTKQWEWCCRTGNGTEDRWSSVGKARLSDPKKE